MSATPRKALYPQTDEEHAFWAKAQAAVNTLTRRGFEDARVMESAVRELVKALRYYAAKGHWRDDDWGCRSVIEGKDYGHGGDTARAALAAFDKMQEV